MSDRECDNDIADDDERKPAAAISHHRPQNPFSRHRRSDRENFPNFADTFLPRSSSTTIAPVASFPSHGGDDEDDADDDDDTSSSILNMSIGARAALAEHLRHIARHGIDGEAASSSSPLHQAQEKAAPPKSILDLKWEYFLGQHSSDAAARGGLDTTTTTAGSPDASFARASSKRKSPHNNNNNNNNSSNYQILFANTSDCFEQSIEVMTDISQDFFNSSRVQELSTPERNRNKVNFVSTRNESIEEDDTDDDDDDADDFLIDEQERADILAPELLVIQSSSSEEHHSHNSHHHHHHHSSFQSSSFCAPDISRISSADDSEVGIILHHQSPNTSFQFHQHLQLDDDPGHRHRHDLMTTPVDDIAVGSPLFLGDISPPTTGLDGRLHQHPLDSSFSSLPSIPTNPNLITSTTSTAFHHHQRHHTRVRTSPSVLNPFGVASSALEGQHPLSPRRSHSAPILAVAPFRPDLLGKENFYPARTKHPAATNISKSLLLQQQRVGANRKGEKSSLSRNHQHHHEPSAFDTMATDFLNAIERERIEDGAIPLSPISQVGSNHVGILYESSSSSSRRRRQRGGTNHHHHGGGRRMATPYPPIIASMPTTTQDTSTSTSSSSSLTGRKRFRTVVPRRVYMGSPSQFPDEHDSFGNITTTTSSSREHGNNSSSSSNESPPAQRSLFDSFEAVVEDGDEDPPITSGCSACYNSY